MTLIQKDKLPIPDGWNSDDLSDFIHRSMYNVFATFDSKKKEYALLKDIDAIFQKAIGYFTNTPEFLSAMLFLRTHSAYRGACRLSMSGQVPETFVLLRSCIENSLYALHVFKKKGADEIWVRRHDDEQSLRKTKGEFTIWNVMNTLKGCDKSLYKKTRQFYENTIDWGAHPNERAVTSSMQIIEKENRTEFKQLYLSGDTTQLAFGLKSSAQVGVCSLFIFRHVFRERFDLIGITEEMKKFKRILL
ncbi:MAG: hypothetical protein MUP22_04690 [Desulfobacterales bacterium]|nr:hypothetical protein [Desulfobacterales bacterium]